MSDVLSTDFPRTDAIKNAHLNSARIRGVAICPECLTDHPGVNRNQIGGWSVPPRCKTLGCHALLVNVRGAA